VVKYRSRVICDECGREYTSRLIKRRKPKPVLFCKFCGSSKTRMKTWWEVK